MTAPATTQLESRATSLQAEQAEAAARARAEQLGLPYAFLVDYPALPDILHLADPALVDSAHLLPYLRAEGVIRVATDLPLSAEQKQALLDWATSRSVKPQLILVSPASFLSLKRLYSLPNNRAAAINPTGEINASASLRAIHSLSEYAAASASASTTSLLDVLLAGAETLRASDIHFEPTAGDVTIRLRIDGVLHPAAHLTKPQYHSLVSRMKLLAKMKIDLTHGPQDGRFSFSTAGHELDLRLATLPTIYGEGITIRLLEAGGSMKKLSELGFRPDLLTKMKQALTEPYGMVLLTGPTGSGKTSALYAMLAELSSDEKKIMTLEDPVEYRLPGIIQSQVEPANKFTFASGLRGALRQDPDILMVGEIRDLDTAEIAVNASLTGHLLLSTLHTNSAPATLARLLNLGVPPYLLAGAINLIVAERLVRKLCDTCAKPAPIKPEIAALLKRYFPKQPTPTTLLQAVGCPVCAQTGYLGRTPIAEVLTPSPAIEREVMHQATIADFTKIAIQEGLVPMEQDGFWLVYLGVTTPEEIWRVTREDT